MPLFLFLLAVAADDILEVDRPAVVAALPLARAVS